MNIQKIIEELPKFIDTLSVHTKKSTAESAQNESNDNDEHEISSSTNNIQDGCNNNVAGVNDIDNQDKTASSGGSQNGNVDKEGDKKIDQDNNFLKCILSMFSSLAVINNSNNNEIEGVKDANSSSNNKSKKAEFAAIADGGDSNNRSNNGSSSQSGHYIHKDSQIRKLHSNLKQIEDALITLWNFQEKELGKELYSQLEKLKTILDSSLSPQQTADSSSEPTEVQQITNLHDINKKITKLKRQIPSRRKSSSTTSQHNSQSNDRVENWNGDGDHLVSNWISESLVGSSVYKEIQGIFNELNDKEKACLLGFAVFPENEEVKERLLTYWWVGEDLIEVPEAETAENIAGKRLKEFMKKGLIEPIYRKQIRGIDHHAKSFRMHPLVRSVLIKLAKENAGNQTHTTSSSKRVILVKDKELKSSNNRALAADQDQDPDLYPEYHPERLELEDLETIFNVDETFPDTRLEMKTAKEGEWSSKMKKYLKVLYLGKWQNSSENHIEVESTRFLEGLKNLKRLRLLSLQGISRINELPNSISKMTSLRILDLKECHTLEVLPKGISYLKQLTHLDVSGCYLLDYMPKGVSSLTKLQVLKGFVICDHKKQSGNLCTLEGLEGMKNLRKLSISISRKEDFPTENDLKSLQKLEKLRKLTLSWGGDSNRSSTKTNPVKKPAPAILKPSLSKLGRTITMNFKAGTGNKQIANTDQHHLKLPENLVKLDLQCFPGADVPKWMDPDQENNLSHLKKLYLRGGGLRDLKYKWKAVEILRLKFLSDMRMNWEQLQESFPKLSLLEKVDCPWVTFCPCDESGMWQNHEN
ncbi:disease resistance RPP13-like protein 4 [Ziziphus jujuba]|uniref:Disease resistance RPP13-like protein 4 n=1 Tax=Ziziphus jujuba TaxID=326968 RepID=A0ABM4AAZ2_ZIZJJ|nr:disease resistance RPP13-like protein 4 [Ziziphus jujuba]